MFLHHFLKEHTSPLPSTPTLLSSPALQTAVESQLRYCLLMASFLSPGADGSIAPAVLAILQVSPVRHLSYYLRVDVSI